MNEPAFKLSEENAGFVYAAVAYTAWGVLPLYWRLMRDVPVLELTSHRMLWCAVVVGIITLLRGRAASILAIIRTPRTFGTLVVTSILITTNWLIYVYTVMSDQLVEASLGYYITPLISFVLGMTFFGERLSRVRMGCIALAAVGVVIQVVELGRLPWLALSLALTFGIYGYLRKRAPVAALDGLLIETGLLLPLTLGYIVWHAAHGTGTFLHGTTLRDVLLTVGGPLTATPLALFAAGVRRIRLTTLGFLQYLSPSITLLLAVFAFGESFPMTNFISFGLVWTAIVIVSLEGRLRPATTA